MKVTNETTKVRLQRAIERAVEVHGDMSKNYVYADVIKVVPEADYGMIDDAFKARAIGDDVRAIAHSMDIHDEEGIVLVAELLDQLVEESVA